MVDNNKKALKSGVWYTMSNFIVKAMGFLTTPIFARILTKADFGQYNNYISWLTIITILSTLNLESTLISARFDYKEKFDEYIFSVLSLSSVSTIIWIVAFNCFQAPISKLFELDPLYLNMMMVYLLFLPAVNLFQSRERYYFEYKKSVATSLFIAIGTSLLSVILVLTLDNKLLGRIAGSIIPTVLIGIVFYVYFLKKGRKIKTAYWKYALPICLPFIPHALSLNLLNSMDRIMITKWCGSEQNALYSLAYTCGSMITLLMVSMNSAYSPWLGSKLNEGLHKEIRSFSKIYISSFFFLAVGIMTVAPEVLYILGGESYLEAKYVLAPISMGCVCQFLYTMFVNIEQFKKKTIGMAFASITAAIVNLVLNTIFIPKFGYLAAAYTTLIGYLCLLSIHMFLVYKLKLNDVYDYRFVIQVIILGMLVTAMMSFMYAHNIIRLLFFVFYVMCAVYLCVRYKDKITAIVKTKKSKGDKSEI